MINVIVELSKYLILTLMIIYTFHCFYTVRQQDEIEKQQRNENTLLPATLDYRQVTGLSNEVIAKLNDHKPSSIGQASRISGITPAAISILLVWLKKQGMLRRSA